LFDSEDNHSKKIPNAFNEVNGFIGGEGRAGTFQPEAWCQEDTEVTVGINWTRLHKALKFKMNVFCL
jgi:hypothetical protein